MRGDDGAAGWGAGMHSTRGRILSVLKRHGRCSVDEVARLLALSPMTVRHHLVALERDDLVTCAEERGRAGRPHYVYSLTPLGESHFRRHDNHLARQILHEAALLRPEEIDGLAPEDRGALIFDRIADRLVIAHQARLAHLPVAQRVAAVTELLREEGGFAEWLPADGGWEVRDYNCCYRDLLGNDGTVCRWHYRLLTGLLGPGLQPIPCTCSQSGARACCFIVPNAALDPAPSARRAALHARAPLKENDL